MLALQFETGDLMIKLSRDPEDFLLVHSELFATYSSIFRASISPAWARSSPPDIVQHPITREKVHIRVLALKKVDDTLVLEGRVRLAHILPLGHKLTLSSIRLATSEFFKPSRPLR